MRKSPLRGLSRRTTVGDKLTRGLRLLQQNGTKKSATDLIELLNKIEIDTEQVEVVVAPPALHLELTQSKIQKNIAVSAQNVSLTGLGAYTGEIAAEQLIGALLLSSCTALRALR